MSPYSAPPQMVRLSFSPDAAYVRTARLVAAAVARRCGVPEEMLAEVRLAVGEACARAVALHRRYALDAPVSVEISDGGSFVVRVSDRGPQAADTNGCPPIAGAPAMAGPAIAAPAMTGTAIAGTAMTGTAIAGTAMTGTAIAAPAMTGPATTGTGMGRPAGHAVGTAGQRAGAAVAARPAVVAQRSGHELDDDPLAEGVGLALLTGLVSDLVVTRRGDGSGSDVRMSWPVRGRSAS